MTIWKLLEMRQKIHFSFPEFEHKGRRSNIINWTADLTIYCQRPTSRRGHPRATDHEANRQSGIIPPHRSAAEQID